MKSKNLYFDHRQNHLKKMRGDSSNIQYGLFWCALHNILDGIFRWSNKYLMLIVEQSFFWNQSQLWSETYLNNLIYITYINSVWLLNGISAYILEKNDVKWSNLARNYDCMIVYFYCQSDKETMRKLWELWVWTMRARKRNIFYKFIDIYEKIMKITCNDFKEI